MSNIPSCPELTGESGNEPPSLPWWNLPDFSDRTLLKAFSAPEISLLIMWVFAVYDLVLVVLNSL